MKQLFVLLAVFIFACKDSKDNNNIAGHPMPVSKANKIFPFDWQVLALHRGDKIDFFVNDDGDWKHQDNASFPIPEGTSEVFSFGGVAIGAVQGNKVNFYVAGEDKKWKPNAKVAFDLPFQVDDIFAIGTEVLALVKGDKIKFYGANDEGKWVEKPGTELTIPATHDAVFISLNGDQIGIINGNKIEFYVVEAGLKYLPRESRTFTDSTGFDGIYNMSTNALFVLKNDKVNIYNLKDEGGWDLNSKAAFTLK